jgi:hypothetical protein
MKIKFDHYVASLFKQSSLLFDNKKGILYYRNKSNKLQELPNQSRNLMKLRKILENHPDNDDYNKMVYEKEIKEINKTIRLNTTKKKKSTLGNRKTKTNHFFGLF